MFQVTSDKDGILIHGDREALLALLELVDRALYGEEAKAVCLGLSAGAAPLEVSMGTTARTRALND